MMTTELLCLEALEVPRLRRCWQQRPPVGGGGETTRGQRWGGSGGSRASPPFWPHRRDYDASAACANDRGFDTSDRDGGGAWAAAVAVAEAAKVLMFSREKNLAEFKNLTKRPPQPI